MITASSYDIVLKYLLDDEDIARGLNVNGPLLRKMVDRLGRAIASDEIRDQMDLEDEIDRIFSREIRKAVAERDQIILAQNQELEAQRQKAEEERQKAEEERQKAEEERQKAETERQKAEEERQKAETERQRAEELQRQLDELRKKLDNPRESSYFSPWRASPSDERAPQARSDRMRASSC